MYYYSTTLIMDCDLTQRLSHLLLLCKMSLPGRDWLVLFVFTRFLRRDACASLSSASRDTCIVVAKSLHYMSRPVAFLYYPIANVITPSRNSK